MVGYEAEASLDKLIYPHLAWIWKAKSAHYCHLSGFLQQKLYMNHDHVALSPFPLKILFNLFPPIALCKAPTPNISSQPSTHD